MLGQVLVNGSMAFDIIMRYAGKFKDHILPDRLDAINLSFLTESALKERGGCAGNIAYAMALLGESPRIMATVGGDFEKYRAYLDNLGVDTSCIATHEDELTATCTICADATNNQLTFVCVGAMSRGRELDLRDCATKDTKLAIVSPEDPIGMSKHCEEARQANIPFIYDPSFQVIAFSGEQLLKDVQKAKALIVNDYEFSLFLEKTHLTQNEITDIVEFVIVTRGSEGSTIYKANCEPMQIKAAKVEKVVDPTGAGDAFRGGLLYGLLHDMPLNVCAQIGSICGSYAVECIGTQNYKFTAEEFKNRYKLTFNEEL
ncbi:carbohydrate kinase family protein [bacterium]|nr:carbohydrate kinase family protein [bacterium]